MKGISKKVDEYLRSGKNTDPVTVGAIFYEKARDYLKSKAELSPEEQIIKIRLDCRPKNLTDIYRYHSLLSHDALRFGWHDLVPVEYENSKLTGPIGKFITAAYERFKTHGLEPDPRFNPDTASEETK